MNELRDKPSALTSMDQRIQIIITILHGEIDQQRSLEELARVVNLSSSRLRHLFKDHTGLTPAAYLKTVRLEKAKELLETTFLSLKQIMKRVGVQDKSHFAKDFKSVYGVAPSTYRRLHGEDGIGSNKKS